jgi:type IV pilus assembly protein PilB
MEKKKIGEILVENGYLTRGQLELALKIQKQDNKGLLGIILLKLKYITPEQLINCLDIQNKFSKDI